MAYRDTLLARLTTVLNSYSQFSMSSELPFVSGGTPLHIKNMKTVYLDEAQDAISPYIVTLDKRDIDQTETVIRAYVAVDAKNKPSQTDSMLSAIQAARSVIAPVVGADAGLTSEIQDDIIVYSVEYRFLTI
jgi:hypothetical protein|nr:MAG TPA: hypothetical protein [Caudoviricetes sp.]